MKNVVFKNNKGVQGGAIYNEGIVNISSKNLVDVLFDGNKNGSDVSEAIYNNGGSVNMAADATSKITFNGRVTGDSTNRGTINIGYADNENLGSVIFNETVSKLDLTLNNGLLQIGQTATAARNDYFQNVNLTLNGGTIETSDDGTTQTLVNAGTLSLENGYLDTLDVGDLVVNDITNLILDLDIGNVDISDYSVQSDNLVASSVSGTNGVLNIERINLIGTLPTENSVVATFINQDVQSSISEAMKSVTLNGKVYSISTAGNQIIIEKQGESGGYAYAVAIDPISERTFQIGDTDVTTRPWIDGKNQLADGGLHVIGVGSGSLVGNGQKGIEMGINEDGFPQVLEFVNIAKYTNFKTAVINDGGTVMVTGSTFSENNGGDDGGVIRNQSGDVFIYGGSNFVNNSVLNNGGAIYNNANLEMNPVAGKNITFAGNTAVDADGNTVANDIYQTENGVINITGANGGDITLGGGIAGLGSIKKIGKGSFILNGDNSNYLGKFIQEGFDDNTGFGGNVVVNSGAKFFSGNSEISNSTLNWYTDNDLANGAQLVFKKSAWLNLGNGTDNAVLTIKGNSDISEAGKITINDKATLNIAKNTTYAGTFANGATGSGILNLTKVLTLTNNASIDSGLTFKSTNGTVVLSETKNTNAILSAVTQASSVNNNLALKIIGANSDVDLTIDGAKIASLTLDGEVTYSGDITVNKTGSAIGALTVDEDGEVTLSGALTNNGSVTNSGKLTFQGDVTGSGTISNSGDLTLTADGSGFTGTYTQTAGSTDITGGVFGGDKNINGGNFYVTSANAIDYGNVHLGSGAQFKHTASSAVSNVVNSSVLDFKGTGAGVLFMASKGVVSNYLLDGNVADANNTVTFENSVVTLGATDASGAYNYTGNYVLKDSTLDLTSTTAPNDYEFANLTTDGTNKLNVVANIVVSSSDPDVRELQTDTLTVNVGSAEFKLGKVFLTGEENGQTEYTTQSNVLVNKAVFSSAADAAIALATGATTAYEYNISLDGNQSFKLSATGITDENSLEKLNKTEGNRFFQFSVGDTAQYNIGDSLSEAATGDFYITGRSTDAADSILSGAIAGSLTDEKGSLFNIVNNTVNLSIENLTIEDALTANNGAVVNLANASSIVSLKNVVLQNNVASGNGGALYLDGTSSTVSDSTIKGNSAANGGAVYVDGTSKITGSAIQGNSADKGGGLYVAGTATVDGTTFDANSATTNGGAIYNAGTLNLKDVTVKAGTATAKNDVYQESTGSITLTGANTIRSDISGSGTITNNGIFTTEGDNSAYVGSFVQNAASTKTTVKGTFLGGTSTISAGTLDWLTAQDLPTSAKLTVSNGILNIGSSKVPTAVLSLNSGSSIAADAKVNINTKLQLDGGSATLNNNDSWNGSVVLNSGDLTLNNVKNGELHANGGNLTLAAGSLIVDSSSSIGGSGYDPVVTLADGTQLKVGGGSVELNANDTWAGDVYLNSGLLSLATSTNSGHLYAGNGSLTVDNNLLIQDGSYINPNVKTDIVTSGNLTVGSNGKLTINANDTWNGKITLTGGTFDYESNKNGTLDAQSGNLNLKQNSVLTLQAPSYIQDAVIVDINRSALVNLTSGSQLNLDKLDKWHGLVKNDGGTFKTTGVIHSTTNGGALQQTSGTSVFTDRSVISIDNTDSYIKGGNLEILNNSVLSMPAGMVPITVDNFKMADNSYLNLLNNEIGTSNIGNFTVDNKNNVTIDISPRTWTHDSFNINNMLTSGKGTLNISDFNFIGMAPIDRHIKLQVFNANNISNNIDFTATDKHIFTPIGNYQLQSLGGGAYSASLTSYNPQVFRGQAATLAAFNNQLMIGDMLTNHFILPQSREVDNLAKRNNTYASTSPLFAPYLNHSLEEGGLWTKNYVSLETLSLTNHLNVGNNTYGTLIGADLPLVQLKNGWKFVPTAYIGYNGGDQHFHGVSMYQNGGQGGFMGTFLKKDFIGSIVAYGGGYFNEMHVNDAIDKTGNWFAGSMAKVAYNLHPAKHFTIQPTALVSYNIFGKQNWGTDYGVMSMNSGMLNGINVAPGINLIYSRDTWSVYGTLQYMFNINEGVSGKAGNVHLANVRARHDFIQYGVGVTKTWKDRLSGYLQVCLRNGGRTGIGFQFGLKIYLGKDPKKVKKSAPKSPKNFS